MAQFGLLDWHCGAFPKLSLQRPTLASLAVTARHLLMLRRAWHKPDLLWQAESLR